MKIVVAMKQIPDLQQIRIRDRQPVFDDVPLTFGNIDKNALEAAVQIKEANEATIIVVSVGSAELEETVKEALAAGADEAKLVTYAGELESSISAQLIAAAVQEINDADLILFGEGSGDNYSSQVSSRTAQILGMPQVNYVSRIELAQDGVIVTRSLEDRDEMLKVKLPAVISVTADINSARIPSVMQILKAGKKPKAVLEADELGANSLAPMTVTIRNLAPVMQRKLVQVKSVKELLQALAQEGITGGHQDG